MLRGTLNKLKIVAIAVSALVVLVVVLQNTQAVETKLLFLKVTMPNAALLFGNLVIGFAIGVLAAGHIISSANPPNGRKNSMRALLVVVVLLLVGIVGLGFYRGWFRLSTNNTDHQPSATLTVDKDKIHADEQKAKDTVQGFGQEAKEKIGDGADKAKE